MSDHVFEPNLAEPVDQRIGRSAMEALDHIRDVYPNAKLEVVCIVAALTREDEEGNEIQSVTYWCEDPRRFVQAGLLAQAARYAST